MILSALLLAFVVQGPAPAKPVVTFTPARPVQGSLLMIRARPAAGDTIAQITGQFSGEPLHFTRDSGGVFVAFAGVPVEAHGTLDLPITIQRSEGAVDSMDVRIPVTSARF